MDNKRLFELLKEETTELGRSQRAAGINKVASKYYRDAPKSDDYFIEFCEALIASQNMCLFSIATLWMKKRKSVIDIKYFTAIEGWLYKYIKGWGTCDQFCYRVLNPFVEKYPQLFSNLMNWISSEEVYIRRAAPVSLIRCGSGLRVKYEFDKILIVVESLIDDSHHHIQKAIGWLLKYSYFTYPEEVLDYLSANSGRLSRTAYRYALEKTPADVRKRMMALP